MIQFFYMIANSRQFVTADNKKQMISIAPKRRGSAWIARYARQMRQSDYLSFPYDQAAPELFLFEVQDISSLPFEKTL